MKLLTELHAWRRIAAKSHYEYGLYHEVYQMLMGSVIDHVTYRRMGTRVTKHVAPQDWMDASGYYPVNDPKYQAACQCAALWLALDAEDAP